MSLTNFSRLLEQPFVYSQQEAVVMQAQKLYMTAHTKTAGLDVHAQCSIPMVQNSLQLIETALSGTAY